MNPVARKLTYIMALLIGGCLLAMQSQGATLENSVLRVSFDAQSATLRVLDKRIDYEWRQDPAILGEAGIKTPDVKAGPVEQGADYIYAQLRGEGYAGLRVSLGPEEATVYVELEAEGGLGVFEPVGQYPYPFALERESGYLVQCSNGEGIVFPMTELQKVRGGGFSGAFSYTGGMPWYGVTDLKKGCIGALTTFRHKTTAKYPMKIQYHFVTDGGYVALAKYYRGIAAMQGKVVTLKEKLGEDPQLEKMLGAPVVYLWGWARTPEFLKEMKKAGIDRALTLWDLNHPPGITGDLVDAANELGYLPGPFDTYVALFDPRNTWNIYLGGIHYDIYSDDRRVWPEGWPWALRNYDPDKENYGGSREAPTGSTVCSSIIQDWAKRRIEGELERFNYQIRYIDTLTPRVEACESRMHPMNLEEAKNARYELLRWLLQDKGQLTASGEGYAPDWSVPVLCWMEGSMTMRPYFDDICPRLPNGGENFVGNRWAPPVICDDVETNEEFWEYEVNPAYRVPLYGLVYHDCAVTTWNWRCANHRYIDGWRAADLMNVLFGNAPMWGLSPEVWDAKKDKLVESFKFVSEWTRKIALDEMTDYRWISPDRKVAMTSFSSGWNVAVNMTDKDFESEKGTVKAMSYLTWKN